MALTLAERSKLIAPSATLAMAAEAKRLKAEGVDVLDFAPGRARLRHPGEHPGGRDPGDAVGPDALHAPRRASPSSARPWPTLYSRQHGLPTEAAQVGRLQRGQAFDPQRPDGRLRARRRGDHSRPVLGQLLRPGQADRRDPGRDRRRPRRAASSCRPEQFRDGRDPADQAADDQQPVEPDGRRLRPRASSRRWPTPCSRPTSASSPTRSTSN